jgi:hypothetical protein
MRKVTRSRKYKKGASKKNKTRKTKTRKTKTRKTKKARAANRRKLRGGMNHLGEVFLGIIKNKKIYKEEAMKHDAQSKQYEEAGWNIEELTEELKTAINDPVKFDKVMALLDEYEYTKESYERELKENDARENKDSQGEYWAQNEYAKLIVELRDDYGIDIDY